KSRKSMFRIRRDPTWDPRPSESNAIPSPGFHRIRRIPVGSDKIQYWIRWDPVGSEKINFGNEIISCLIFEEDVQHEHEQTYQQ
ncbi:unnamed protein product, partial [Adineta ricciae]